MIYIIAIMSIIVNVILFGWIWGLYSTIWELRKRDKAEKEELEKREVEENRLPPRGEWVKMKDVQDVMAPMLRRFYNAEDEDIECIIQEIEQKAWLIK